MVVDPSTIFLGLAFIATMLTIGGFIIPSITLRVGSAFMWLICAIFILFSPTLYSAPIAHAPGSDTSLGTQIENLDMGTFAITNVGLVDGVDISSLSGGHTQGTDTALGIVGTKNPPLDADKIIYRDSNTGDSLVTSTFTELKAFFKTYFDGIYSGFSDNTTGVGTNNYIVKWTGTSTQGNATNTDTQVSDAVGKAHMQGTDTSLGTLGADLNMGVNDITNVGLVDGVDVSAISLSDATQTFLALNEPTGFINRTDSSWSFYGGATRTLSVTTGSHYDIWFQGTEHAISTTENITIADTEGIHLIYFDTDDTLHEYVNPTTVQLYDSIRNKCLVGYVYWDATNDVGVYVGEERHGTIMDGMTHYELHNTRGLQYVSGLGLGDFVIGNGSLNTHAQFSVATGSLSDEDIGLTVSPIVSTTGLPILYRSGANGDWRTVTQAGYSIYPNPSGATHRLVYNQLTGGSWTTTEVGKNDYVLCHIFMTTGKVNQIYSVMGQNTYTTSPMARTGATTEISNLLMGNLPSAEIRPVATVIFQTSEDYANTIKAKVVEVVTGGDDYVSWLTTSLPRGTLPADHGSLTGLSDDDHDQYLLVDGTRSMTGNLNMGTENITMSSGKTVDGVDISDRLPTDVKTFSIEYVINGGGSAIAPGIKGDLEIPSACTITKATAMADQNGTLVVSIWKDTYANYPPLVGDNITAGAPITIVAGNAKIQDSVLTGWNKTINANDILRFNVDSCTSITRVVISLIATKN
jgi:hypothetical protein